MFPKLIKYRNCLCWNSVKCTKRLFMVDYFILCRYIFNIHKSKQLCSLIHTKFYIRIVTDIHYNFITVQRIEFGSCHIMHVYNKSLTNSYSLKCKTLEVICSSISCSLKNVKVHHPNCVFYHFLVFVCLVIKVLCVQIKLNLL